jgi:hypothetical protein
VLDGAYTHRFVVADDAEVAAVRAKEVLRSEHRFQQFRAGSTDGSPRVEVDEVRSASWLEGRGRVPGIVFYDETTPTDRERKKGAPPAGA